MTAVFGPWTVNGAIEIPNYHRMGPENEVLNWPQLHSKIDGWIRNYKSISKKVQYSQPFVHFCIQQMPNGAWDAHAQLDVEKVKYGSVQIKGLNGKIDYQSQSQTNDPLYRLSFKADAADYRQGLLHLSGKAITGFSQSTTAALGTHLENLKVSLLSPQVTINQLAKFNVPTVELQLTKSGLVNIKGVSFLKELSQQMPAKLARFEGCSFGTGTKIDFCLDYCPQAAEIKSLSGKLNAQDFRLKNLFINHIYSAFSWNQNSQEIRLHKASLKRGNEWIHIDGIADLARKDYCLAIKASAIPTDYNPIMPDWWHKIFRDIHFFEQPRCDANFEVSGRFGQRVADFYFGSVHAQNLAYRGVPIDRGQLCIRGRQHYSEIIQLVAQQGAYKANGSIKIAALPDPIKAPLFWSLDIDSSFPLEAYQKLVSPKVAAQIQLFEANQAPEVHFKGKFFTKHYPQYRPYMHFQMHADSLGPIYYQNVPLEALQFKLVGNAEQLSIHDLKASIANGRAAGQIDFDWQSGLTPSMRIKGAIQGCDTKKLLKMFHEAERAALSNLAPIEESTSKIDLEVHLKGPTGNWFEFNGYGRAAMHGDALGSIKLLGPLSSLLQKTPLNFTSLKFKTLDSGFELAQSSLYFDQLTIGGHSSQIKMKGRYNFELDSLDMFATLHPLINYADKLNPVTPLNRL
ncbi:MAG: AsmA-like C-terminal region-containing protein, partial [Opitutales bacterium]